MRITAQELTRAWHDWTGYSRQNPEEAVRLLRRPAYFLVTPHDNIRHAPIRYLICHANGIPFEQRSGRSFDWDGIGPDLLAMGLARVDESTVFFDALFRDWQSACLATGQAVCSYIGDNPRTGRVFFVAPGPMPVG